ncbi:hypothetical protein [Streptomyces candidus]|uniref:CHASE2 domain-containing sensor protein n=1 Tax=Streptomyces candidus TaxID=67283 RepID=A0A7X0HLN3_9ACTN|nr:hypothetical protein [Streptomyces candidus]MBB6439982.1 CHASE2 domain-containing sensor protein [Streptomyces candidus]GHH57480.1 hypothetical protein GCM10018773_64890 [Streptomyces candidus]
MTSRTPRIPDPDDPQPFLSIHTALVLLMAAFIGVVVGVLTFYARQSIPEALLAGLASTGLCIASLRNMIG